MTTRRNVLIAFGASALTAPLASFAQPLRKVWRVGFLGATSASGIAERIEAFRLELSSLGYIEGKNLMIEFRWAEGNYEKLPGLASELVDLKVDVIVAVPSPAIRAAQQSTATIPIVMANTGDPVGA